MELDNSTSFIQNFDEIVKSLNSKTQAHWLIELRNTSLSRFKKIGLPSIKDDEFKYTNISPITKHTYHISEENTIKEAELLNAYMNLEDISLVFVNGIFSKDLSVVKDIPGGFNFSSLESATLQDDPKIRELFYKYHPDDEGSFITLNNMLCSDGAFIRINKNALINKSIHIIYVTKTSDRKLLSSPRSLIFMDDHSQATIIESHISFASEQIYLSNALADIFLSKHARLDHFKLQDENTQAFHLGQTRIWQEMHSGLNSFSVNLGAKLARNNTTVVVNGEEAITNLYGMYAPDNHQHFDNRTSIDHRMPNSSSNQQFIGVLGDFTNTVYDGKISIRPIAHGVESSLSNTNLIIGKDCHVYCRPQIENSSNNSSCKYKTRTENPKNKDISELESEGYTRNEAIKTISKKLISKNLEKIRSPSIYNRVSHMLENKINKMNCK